MKIRTDNLRSEAPVYCVYDGQLQAQPAYIEVDGERQEVMADYSGDVGGGVPEAVWNGRVRRLAIPATTSRVGIEALLSDPEWVAIFQRMLNSYETVWNSNNHVGNWEKEVLYDLEDYEYLIEAKLQDYLRDYQIAVYTPAEWFEADASFIEDDYGDEIEMRTSFFSVSAETSDDDIRDYAEEQAADAENADVVIDGDIAEYLTELRDEYRERRAETA